MRSYDHDGRLHVEITPISKANICPYYGREIPKWQSLGLQPDKIYQLFRDPEELRSAAQTSNGLQVLELHRLVTPDEPGKTITVGAVGTNASFELPFLKNSLTIWDKEAIRLIESKKKKQLSCGYRYDADMTPGFYLGVKYDGVMRNIRFNHITLVEDGRAGADVMVADAMPLEFRVNQGVQIPMPKFMPTATPRALVARGALAVFLPRLLANDANIDFKKLVPASITKANWEEVKETIIGRVHNATRGVLAKDADLDDLPDALAALDAAIAVDEWQDQPEPKKIIKKLVTKLAKDRKMAKDDDDDDDKKDDDDDDDDDDKKKVASDEDDDDDKKDDDDDDDKKKVASDSLPKGAKGKKTVKDVDSPVPVTRAAMDAAIDKAVRRATADTEARIGQKQKDCREAEAIVRPVMGALLGMDSAAEVYEKFFEAQGIDYDDVPEEAYKPLAVQTIKLAAKAKEVSRPKHLAMDSKAAAAMATLFPAGAAVRVI